MHYVDELGGLLSLTGLLVLLYVLIVGVSCVWLGGLELVGGLVIGKEGSSFWLVFWESHHSFLGMDRGQMVVLTVTDSIIAPVILSLLVL